MRTYIEDHPPAEVIPSLRREWMILASRRWMIGLIVAVAVVCAAAYNYAARPLYEGVAIVSAGEALPGQPYTRLNADVARLKGVVDKEIAVRA